MNLEGITPPRDYYYNLIGKENPRRITHTWSDISVREILNNEAYIGNLVQFKTGSISYKNHKQVRKPPESWIRIEKTHEPMIPLEQWKKAQELAQKSKTYRSNKAGEISLFSGLLECGDCHMGMKFTRDSNTRKDGHRNNHHAYICCTYSKGGKGACTPHRTLESIFTDLILGDIREKAAQISIDEDTVIAEIKRKKNADTSAERWKKIFKQSGPDCPSWNA